MHQSLVLYLAPGALPVETEVRVFDFLDLVGNVGGFLGLLLGASFLSLLDETKALFDKYFTKKRRN